MLFWWPAFGDWGDHAVLPPPAPLVVREVIGVIVLGFVVRRFGLGDRDRRREFCPDRQTQSVLILARHGRTAANAQRLLLGRMDVPLDEFGTRQAAAIGAALARQGCGARAASSPARLDARRTTALAIADAFGVDDVTFDDRWLEVDYGEFDGAPLADVPHEVWQHWRSDPAWTPPDGESLAAVGVARARRLRGTDGRRGRRETF